MSNTLDLTFGHTLVEHGVPLVKRPSVVYAAELSEETTVVSSSGLKTTAKAGDFVLFDPSKRALWTVPADYVGENYEPVTLAETSIAEDPFWTNPLLATHTADGFVLEDEA